VNGGIIVVLCQAAGAPAGTPTCEPGRATITETIDAAEIRPMPGPILPLGIEAGNFEELVAAIRAGRTYVDVHSTKFPNGELRGQVGVGRGNPPEHNARR